LYKKKHEKYKFHGYFISPEKYFYYLFLTAKFCNTKIINSKIYKTSVGKKKKQSYTF